MVKNQVLKGIVEGLGTNGEGVIKMGDTTVFVPYALVGEEVSFKVLFVKGNIAYGKLEEVFTPVLCRVEPTCPVFFKCGGCNIQHMDYSTQLSFKRQQVERSLKKIGNIDVQVNQTVASSLEYAYRNKLAFPIGIDKDGNTVIGAYAERSHRIVGIDSCPIQREWATTLISSVKRFIEVSNLQGFDEVTKRGELKHIVAREIDGNFLFVLVATKMVDVKALISELAKNFKNFSLYVNINDGMGNGIFGKEWHLSYGSGYFFAEDMGVKYKAGAEMFLQINDDVRAKLYSAVVAEAEDVDVAIDLYSGGGMMTALLAKNCQKAYGVEVVQEATDCANQLMSLNNLQGKMINKCGKVEEEVEDVIQATQNMSRLIVCDPPRKGMERKVIEVILQAKPHKIALVSCNPATLARDLGLLLGTLYYEGNVLVRCENPQSDYEIESITPFDMFPQTKHVETLVVLRRK